MFLPHLVRKIEVQIIIILEWCFQRVFEESSHHNHLGDKLEI